MAGWKGASKWIVVMGVAGCFCAAAACDRERTEPEQHRSSYHSQQEVAKVHLQLLMPEEQDRLRYGVARTIKSDRAVSEATDILQLTNWERAKVDMSRPPDYKLETINAGISDSFEPATYAIWLTPRKDRLEIIVEGKPQYAKLGECDSRTLMKLLRIGGAEEQEDEPYDRDPYERVRPY